MTRRRRRLAGFLVSMLVVAACSTGSGSSDGAAPPSPAVGTATGSPTDTGATSGPGATTSPGGAPRLDQAWATADLVDVTTGGTFRIADLVAEGKVVFLETMAIWCTNCRAQMHRVVEAHGMADFHSVGIDVDPSERAEDLKDYVEREGFDWPFAMADAEVAGILRDRLGQAFMFPPNTPMVLLMPDGEVRPLDFGGYSVDALLAELAA